MTLSQQKEVFRTGRPHEILMALNELREANIPVFAQEEGGGLVTAMPQTPVAGPDTHWVIKVPESAVNDAMHVLESLPIEVQTNPGSWHFQPGKPIERVWKKGIRIGLVIVMVAFIIAWLFRMAQVF